MPLWDKEKLPPEISHYSLEGQANEGFQMRVLMENKWKDGLNIDSAPEELGRLGEFVWGHELASTGLGSMRVLCAPHTPLQTLGIHKSPVCISHSSPASQNPQGFCVHPILFPRPLESTRILHVPHILPQLPRDPQESCVHPTLFPSPPDFMKSPGALLTCSAGLRGCGRCHGRPFCGWGAE